MSQVSIVTKKSGYFRRTRLSEATLRQILRHFANDLTAADCGCKVTTARYRRC